MEAGVENGLMKVAEKPLNTSAIEQFRKPGK